MDIVQRIKKLKLQEEIEVLTVKNSTIDLSIPKPVVKAVEQKPVVKAVEQKPVVKAVEQNPVVKAVEQKPVVKAVEQKPVVKAVEQKSIVKAVEQKPVVKAVEQKPVVKAVEQKPVVKAVEQKSIVKAVEQKSIVKAVEQKSIVKFVEQKSIVKDVEQKPYTLPKFGIQVISSRVDESYIQPKFLKTYILPAFDIKIIQTEKERTFKSMENMKSLKDMKSYTVPKFDIKLISKEEEEVIKRSIPKYIKPTFITNAQYKSTYKGLDNLHYNTPIRNDLAVLLVFFDYIGSARILINYLYMREKMKLANIPIFTLELVLNGKRPKINDAIHVYGSSYLFQKEHLIRLLEKRIPQVYDKVVCLDADVLFNDENWYDNLSILLDTNDVVQCFYKSYWLDITYRYFEIEATTCLLYNKQNRFFWDPKNKFHPGFAWAFTRNFYRRSGFFDLAVIGSGDTFFAYGILNQPIHVRNIETRIYYNSYNKWLSTIDSPKYAFLNTELYHLYHGPKTKRQYVSRFDSFINVEEIEDVLEINRSGAYELTNPTLNNAMIEFFKTRDDDGIN